MPTNKGTLLLKHSQIVIHWTDGRIENFPLVDEKTRIGRGKVGNEIAIPDVFQSVSRQHLEIRREKAGYRLIDLGSRNGTLVNGIDARDKYLKDGDEISIGHNEQRQQIRIIFQQGSEGLLEEISAADQALTLPPTSGLDSEAPEDMPYFKIRWQNGSTNYYPITKDRIIIGRGVEADLRVPENLRFVSGQHAEVQKEATGFFIRDLNSTNGTLVNNQLLPPDQDFAIGNESIIRIGDDNYGVSIGLTFYNPQETADSVAGFMQAAQATRIEQATMILVGRLENCDIALDSPEVSRRHAMIRQIGDSYVIEDLDSSNGTYVNNVPVKTAELHEGDLIQISNYRLLFQSGMLVPYQMSGMRLDAINLTKDVKTKNGMRRILDNIDLSVLPREFIGLVGGSGAGKSTLLNALIGIRRGTGEVKLNGYDFYEEYESFRAQIGYVPQSDILHTSLTVEKALDYATRLRLPSELSHEERMRRIDMVLDTVSMNTESIRKTRISNLSGGQRKRVSIAAELLADPKLIFLDEATSGLDPGLEKKMMHTLRRMADEGRTVVLITHATDNIVQTDHVAFLSEGKLVYFGPSEEALDFFEVDEFADIYERIDRKGEEWQQIFEEKKPKQHKKYILDRKAGLQSIPKRALPRVNFGFADFFRQFYVLMQRSLSVLFSDPLTLFLMLLLFPVTATLQLVIAKPDILTGDLAILADPVLAAKSMLESYTPFPHTNTFVFVMGLEAVLTGLFVPSNDLVKERSIYLRERMVNLRVLPYLFNKVAIYSVFVVVQVVLYLVIVSFGVDIPEKGLYLNGYLELFLTLYLTMMAGISFGLIISAVSRSTEMAIYILTMLLFFQFFFAGAVFDLRGNKFEPMSYFSTTRWSLTALGVTIGMDEIAESTILCNEVPENPLDPNTALKTVCFHYPDAKDDLRLNYNDDQLLRSWFVLAGMTVLFLAVTWFLIERTDSA
ncbi:MAG TPA: FHA domain-containing protein [Anaerolineales bacterium]|nr:FHA domain-containing protein [Anaerolineales bacterium]